MIKPRILVTGATGKTGGAVLRQLRSLDYPVRAIVRTRDERSERLERLGAETVVADLYDPEQLLAAMRGTQRAYYCPPTQPFMIQSAVAFAVAAREARLETIVELSQWLSSPAHPALMTRHTWLADHLFSMIPGTAFTIVNPGFFADNYLRLINFAAHLGIFPSLFGDTRNAPPSNEDIARVVVATLLKPDLHNGKRYRPTGPDLLSTADMVVILSRVLGRTVRRVPMPIWMLLKAGRMQGASAFEMSVFVDYIQDHIQGAFELGGPSNDILEVTGLPAESFETTARRYAAMPDSVRNLRNTLRTVSEFVRTPFSPGYNLKALYRGMQAPVPPNPRFSLQDAQWTLEHRAQNAQPRIVSELRSNAFT
jgi:uncharacterized protein YbjT (DUF2867 family)